MRGLKPDTIQLGDVRNMSHLLQMRGLKHPIVDIMALLAVASFTDAWIETSIAYNDLLTMNVASFTDAWIETGSISAQINSLIVASFTDAWIETTETYILFNVDAVASFTDAWIETDLLLDTKTIGKSHLLQMRGLKLLCVLWKRNLP